MREYFPAKYRLDNCIRYCLWSTTEDGLDIDRDEVWTSGNFAPCFPTLEQVLQFAYSNCEGKINANEPTLHDLDYIDYWLHLKKMKRARQFYPGEVLSAWNIFSDLARSLSLPFRGDGGHLTPQWEKLLFGDPHRRITHWSGRELQTTHKVLTEGLEMWRAHLRKFPSS